MQKSIITSPLGDKCLYSVLDNGLRVYITQKENYSSAYALFGTCYGSVDTFFSTDGNDYTGVPEGIAHFLEHKLFESEEGDAFTRFSATGAYANAYTSFDRTCYLFSCGTSFFDNLEILLDFVQHPYFTSETVKKEQGIIGQEIKMYDDSPEWCVFFNALKAMYQNHPVKIDIAGTEESIAQIDDKLLYSCYNTFYHPSNMFVCIAGNINPDETLEFIKKNIRKTDKIKIFRGDHNEPYEIAQNKIEKVMDCAIPLFCYGYKLKPVTETKTKIAINVALDIISGDYSELYRELTDDGLINDTFCSELFCGNDYTAVLFQGESRDPEKVKCKIDNAVKHFQKCGIDEEMFKIAEKSAYGDIVKRFDSVSNIASGLVEYAVCDIKPFEDIECLQNLKSEDVNTAIRMFDSDNAALSVIKNNTEA